MIPFEKAFETVMSKAPPLSQERIGIDEAPGRVLAEDVKSDMNMPPFDKSAMDGYACRREDLGEELTIVESIPAGHVPQKSVGAGQCSRIMTGAMVPTGADCVVMQEFTESPHERTMRFVGTKTADNICREGEDVRTGDAVLRTGTRIGPQHVAVLASVGCAEPLVSCRPKVAVIATGNELVEPTARPGHSQIRNSNSYQLVAQVARADSSPRYYGIARDTDEAIDVVLKQAMAECDVILVSGGVSVGEFDLVPKILEANGIELIFETVAIKPGKPTVFGVSEAVCCFGLPGNPVSTFILFELLVKPFLYRMMGYDYRPATSRVRLEKRLVNKRTDRTSWVPAAFTDRGGVTAVAYHGSAHIHALCAADGLVCIPAGVSDIPEGTVVDVRQL